MKKILVILISICLLTGIHYSQAQSIAFCKSVDKDGRPLNAAQEFTVSKSGATLVFLFQFGTTKPASISYDVYRVEKGKEVFASTMKQSLDPGKNWLSKEVTMYDAGVYRVYVYDDKDNLVTKSGFTLKPASN